MGTRKAYVTILLVTGLFFSGLMATELLNPAFMKFRILWPKTDFTHHDVFLNPEKILAGGPSKDGIPSIDHPQFQPVQEAALADTDPVISLVQEGDARAYPLRILMWHEIVNDTVGGVPLAVTYCPLCNSSIVFDRRHKGETLEFGTTGLLYNSNLIMYDRQTESWWQQLTGRGIVGTFSSNQLNFFPSRLESLANFRMRHKDGKILISDPQSTRNYGQNPYSGYDNPSKTPFMYREYTDISVPALARVVVVEDGILPEQKAWALTFIQDKVSNAGLYKTGSLKFSWKKGQNSALDTVQISDGRDVGTVVVQKKDKAGVYHDIPYHVSFAFAYKAFYPQGEIIKR